MAISGALSTKQSKAISALLTTKTVLEAAELAGVGARTLTRWLTENEFKAALHSAEGELVSQAGRRLLTLQEQAIDLLSAAMNDDKAPMGARIRAAQLALEYSIRIREFNELEQRIARLEEQLK
jgi:phage terminase small subunit